MLPINEKTKQTSKYFSYFVYKCLISDLVIEYSIFRPFSLREELVALQNKCARTQNRLNRYKTSHQFLESCVESNNTEFHEVRDLIMRNDTLVANHQACFPSSYSLRPIDGFRFTFNQRFFQYGHCCIGVDGIRDSESAAYQRPEAGAQEVYRGMFA